MGALLKFHINLPHIFQGHVSKGQPLPKDGQSAAEAILRAHSPLSLSVDLVSFRAQREIPYSDRVLVPISANRTPSSHAILLYLLNSSCA